jgi:transcriptional regulator with XRE-family HTH domain
VHLTTSLREIRGARSVKDIAAASGVNAASVRQIEQGRLLPKDSHIAGLERAYGVGVERWYTPAGLVAIQEGDGTE